MSESANVVADPAPKVTPDLGAGQRKPISKPVLLLFTFFLGGIGAHKFYLGKVWQGALYLLLSWTLFPAIVAIIEFVVYLFTSPVRFNEKYSARISPWVVVLMAVGFFVMLGILVAIAISSFNDYKIRSKAAEGLVLAAGLKMAIGESFGRNGPADMTCQPGNCPFTVGHLGPTPYVRRVFSDRTGAITIEYDEQVAPAPQNRLATIPQIDGKAADLSRPDNAGKYVTWKCGQDAATTVAAKHLPSSCR